MQPEHGCGKGRWCLIHCSEDKAADVPGDTRDVRPGSATASDSGAEKGYIITRYYHVIKSSGMATSLKIDDGLKTRVQQLARQRRRSAHWIMLEAIEQYVQREEARESFKQEAVASWTAYQETGRHLTGPEVRAWLSTWGTDDEKAVPECHK